MPKPKTEIKSSKSCLDDNAINDVPDEFGIVHNKKKNVAERREMFIKSVKSDPFMERELTTHIASRWYRAPEIILLEKAY